MSFPPFSAIPTPQSSSQWATYFAKTSSSDHESNYFGSLVKVGANIPERIVNDAQRSFPSGHSSLSFAGLTWLTGFFRHALRVKSGDFFSLRAATSFLPLILAAYIAVSRVRDRKHNVDDVSIGAMIGALGAILAWTHLESAEGRMVTDSTNNPLDSSSSRPLSRTNSSNSGAGIGGVSFSSVGGVANGGVSSTSANTRSPTAASNAINSENNIKIVLQSDAVLTNTNSTSNSTSITLSAPVPVERRQLISRDALSISGSHQKHLQEEEGEEEEEVLWQSNRGGGNFSNLSVAPV